MTHRLPLSRAAFTIVDELEDFLNLGSVHHTKPGDYVIAGPGRHNLPIPTGTHRIDSTHVQNWLPTPRGAGFELIWRLLAPKPGRIAGILNGTGWEPPAITPTP